MKRPLLPLFTVLLTIAIFLGCTKNQPETPPAPTPTPLTRMQILTKYTWQVDEIWTTVSGANKHYVRNGVNTTGITYEKTRMTFKADSTGSYTDETGVYHTTTWKFTSADLHNVQFNVGAPNPASYTWNMMEISDSSFSNITPVGTGAMVASRFVPVGDIK